MCLAGTVMKTGCVLGASVWALSLALAVCGCSVREEGLVGGADGAWHGAAASGSAGVEVLNPEDAGDELQWDWLREMALTNNPGLRGAHAAWQAALAKVPQSRALPDPRATYGYFLEPVETRTGPQEQRVGLSQMLPWFGTLPLRERMAIAEAEAAFQTFRQKELALLLDLKTAFLEYGYLRAAIELSREHLELLGLIESVTAARFSSGMLSQSALIQVQMERGKADERIRSLEARRPAQSALILALIGGGATDSVLPWPERNADRPESFSLDDWMTRMLAQNPTLQRLRLLQERGRDGVRLARKAYYPDLTLGFEVIDIDGGDNPAMASIGLNLPIWRGRLAAGQHEASERLRGVEAELADHENRLSAELATLFFQYEDAQRKVALYHDSLIPKARQAIEVGLKGFEGGQVRFADLLDAERTLLEFLLTEAREEANRAIRAAEIEALIGE